MALVAGGTKIGLKETGTKCTIPNNDKARLMYYLDCMCSVLKLDDDREINRLRRYENYSLNGEDTDKLVALCYLLSPDVLMDKCIFHSDALCGDSNNEFYELSAVQTHFAVTNSILIGGQRKQVQKIMTFKVHWIKRFWADPIVAVLAERERQKKRQKQTCTIM